MLFIMFWLNWDFTLIAVAVTPFMLLLVSRFKKAVKKATHEVRKEQSKIVSVVRAGTAVDASGESVRAPGSGRRRIYWKSAKRPWRHHCKARRVKALLSPIVSMTVALCTAIVLWRGSALILAGAMTAGALTVFLSYLTKFFKPVQDLAKMTNSIAQAAVGVERVRAILDADTVIPEKARCEVTTAVKGEIEFEHVAFAYTEDSPVLKDVSFHIQPGQMVGLSGRRAAESPRLSV